MPSRQLVDLGIPTTGATVVPTLGGCNLIFSTADGVLETPAQDLRVSASHAPIGCTLRVRRGISW